MKANVFAIIMLSVTVLMYAFGFITSKYTTVDPTPEQCLSICVEEFEKYGC